MGNYVLTYVASYDDFQLEVKTNIHIYAKGNDEALKAAEKLDQYIWDGDPVLVCYRKQPYPHISLTPCNPSQEPPSVLSYQVFQPQQCHDTLNGIPIYTSDDFLSVTENQFLSEFQSAFPSLLEKDFELISYGIQLCSE